MVLSLVLGIVSCGSDAASDEEGGDGNSIVISDGMVFATTSVTAAAGSTLTVVNNDDVAHTVTSESAEDAFDDTGDFDVTVSAEGTALLTVPDAASGDVFFFYCRFHTSVMSPANGTITIE